MNKYLGLLKPILLITVPTYIIHYLFFEYTFLNQYKKSFYYNIYFLYLLFFVFTLISLCIIKKVSEKNFDSTGMAFMLVTTIKTVISYLVLKPILNSPSSQNIEKANFFFVFILFLVIETVISITILKKRR